MSLPDHADLESQVGTVVTVNYPRAIVRVSGMSCARCMEGRGCGMGLLGSGQRPREIEARIPERLGMVKPGQRVRLMFGRQELLRSTWVIYGVPLLSLLSGLGLLALVFPDAGDGVAVGVAVISLAIGATFSAVVSRRRSCVRSLVPSVALSSAVSSAADV